MTISRKLNVSIYSALLMAALSFIAAHPALADTCYDLNGEPPKIGTYLGCTIPQIFGFFQIIIVAITIIMTLILITKAMLNRDNPDFLSQLPTRAMWMLIMVLLALGFGGTVFNWVLQLFGFGDFQKWLDVINAFFEKLDIWVS